MPTAAVPKTSIIVHPARISPAASSADGAEGHRHPHRPRYHHHGQHPRLTSENIGTRPEKDLAGP
jgi:hypothetical protein